MASRGENEVGVRVRVRVRMRVRVRLGARAQVGEGHEGLLPERVERGELHVGLGLAAEIATPAQERGCVWCVCVRACNRVRVVV